FLGTGFAADNSKQLAVTEDTFKCLADMTKAEGTTYFVDNILGNLAATLAVATSGNGGTFPAGSVISMVPNEVMIKHEQGWNPASNDWEFFLLGISEEGTTITSRGGVEVINPAGSCMGCHALARPEWDLVCSNDHGCAPIPFTREQIAAVQQQDPRCRE
ncbi:MAG: hypothetical protein RL120_14160, partial [Gammaproteobacteria bacterium]